MLLQTNSYIVPREKRAEHARLLRRFRQTLLRLGCDHFEVYEQVGANWNTGETTGRFVQILRFRDRKHQLSVQGAERTDPIAQALVQEFCELINFPYQQQQGLFAVGFYTSFLRMPTQRTTTAVQAETSEPEPMNELPPPSPEPGVMEEMPESEASYASLPLEAESAEGEDFNATAEADEPEPAVGSELDEVVEGELADGMSEEELQRAQAAIDGEEPAEGEHTSESEHETNPAER